MIKQKKQVHRFRRMCKDCELMFLPVGKYAKYCPTCLTKRYKLRLSKRLPKKKITWQRPEKRILNLKKTK
jgi:Zn finger protein HypA/HybF involved in hydrogenase expression